MSKRSTPSLPRSMRSASVKSASVKNVTIKTPSKRSKLPVRAPRSLIPVRINGTIYCTHHPEREVTLVCEDCEGTLVCVECVTSTHQRHGLVKLIDVAPLKRENIKTFIEKAERTAIPKVRRQVEYANERLAENKSMYKELVVKVRQQGQTLKEEIDRITNKFVQQCEETEKENNDKMLKYRKQLHTLYAELNLSVHESQKTLETGNPTQVYSMEKKVSSAMKLPTAPSIKLTFFNARSLSLDQIEQNFGGLTSPDEQTEADQQTAMGHPATRIMQDMYDDSASGIFDGSDSGMLNMPYHGHRSLYCLSEFEHTTDIHSLHSVSNSPYTWILDIFTYDILLVNKKGKLKDKRELKVIPDDLCLSPVTGNMWVSSEDDYKIREAGPSEKTPRVRFHSTDLPLSLCITRDNKVMVGTHKTVTVYTPEGEVVQRTTTDRTKRQMVTFPRHIAQCPVSGNIAVADGDDPEWGGDDKPHVMVMDSNLLLQFRYRGNKSDSAGKKKSGPFFDPYDMCFDAGGNLIIADRNNRALLLINREGRYISTLHEDKARPVALSLQNENILWVGFDRGKVKVFRYS
ncbi:E3 ubiquitin-protein ligase TRIM71-like [Argopecten irradians]|uniref:E3 ubiquitin-protein ligase TRIM71-like n=1 Tax=Argopecten irradians TaxID=31199 RepID=UPI003713D321